MNVVAYIRVSSKGQDYAMQRLAIERAAAARGEVVGEWYAEKKTAKTMDRPELARLLADVRARKVGRVYVWRLDRLTRTGIRDTLDTVEEFRSLGVELVNLCDGFNVPAPGVEGSAAKVAELILSILAWAAEMELLTRRERISARRELADERGEAWGRPSRLTAADRAAILDRLRNGATVREVAAAMKVPRSTVGRVQTAARLGAGVDAEASKALQAAGPAAAERSAELRRRLELSQNPPPAARVQEHPKTDGEPPVSR